MAGGARFVKGGRAYVFEEMERVLGVLTGDVLGATDGDGVGVREVQWVEKGEFLCVLWVDFRDVAPLTGNGVGVDREKRMGGDPRGLQNRIEGCGETTERHTPIDPLPTYNRLAFGWSEPRQRQSRRNRGWLLVLSPSESVAMGES